MARNEFLEFDAPSGAFLRILHEGVESRRDTAPNLAQRRNSTQRTPLQLGSPLQVLLHRVLRDRRALHRFLEQGGGLVETLRHGPRRELGKAEEHHVGDHLDLVRVVRQAWDDTSQELVEVELVETCIELETMGPHGEIWYSSTESMALTRVYMVS